MKAPPYTLTGTHTNKGKHTCTYLDTHKCDYICIHMYSKANTCTDTHTHTGREQDNMDANFIMTIKGFD